MPPAPFKVKIMSGIYDNIIASILNELESDARRILEECVNEREYTHRTKNLYDSYGYGIYIRGKLKRIGYLSPAPQASVAKSWYGQKIKGRTEIRKYLSGEYHAGNGIELAMVAAMPYAGVLEEGGGNLTRKYRVISMSFQKLEGIANKYKGTVKAIK